jgi:hypothetical protein
MTKTVIAEQPRQAPSSAEPSPPLPERGRQHSFKNPAGSAAMFLLLLFYYSVLLHRLQHPNWQQHVMHKFFFGCVWMEALLGGQNAWMT